MKIKLKLPSKTKKTIASVALFIIVASMLLSPEGREELRTIVGEYSQETLGISTPLPSELAEGEAYVTKVVDGDTIKVLLPSGETETVRLIGINTPETKDPRRPVECFGKEASAKAQELMEEKIITLEEDKSQGDRDRYGRLLRYVFNQDSSNINQQLIKEGYAYEYTYNNPYRYQEDFQEAERQAQEGEKGLWGEDECVRE